MTHNELITKIQFTVTELGGHAMTHNELITKIQLAIAELGGRAWETIPGVIYVGRAISRKGNQIMLAGACAYTLYPVGEPDLHCYFPAEINGEQILLFGKIEAKTLAYPELSKKQKENLSVFAKKGGLALVVRETKEGVKVEKYTT